MKKKILLQEEKNTIMLYLKRDKKNVKKFLELYPGYETVIYRTDDFAKLIQPAYAMKIKHYIFDVSKNKFKIINENGKYLFIDCNSQVNIDTERLFKINLDVLLYAIEHNELDKLFEGV